MILLHMIKKAFLASFVGILFGFSTISAQPRTDGPPGSEYGPPHWAGGQFQAGLVFGSMFRLGEGSGSSLAAGLDLDYRPYDLFGLRASYTHSFQNHRGNVALLAPLIHGEFANLKPHLSFGPGIATVKFADGNRKLRFALGATIGGDVMVTDLIGVGLLYQYATLIDGPDLHNIAARVVFSFGRAF